MKKYLIAICALSLITHAIAQETAEVQADSVKTKEAIASFQSFSKAQLQEELKRLQRDVLAAQEKLTEAKEAEIQPTHAYQSATNEQKPDKLIPMLEAQSRTQRTVLSYNKIKEQFGAAQQAYLQLMEKE
jgi:hypothetical protein